MSKQETFKKIRKINEDKLKIIELNKDFLHIIQHWRRKIGIPKEGFTNNQKNKVSKIFTKEKTAFLPSEATNEIIFKFKLSPNYFNSIINYLFYNQFSQIPSSNCSIILTDGFINVRIFKKPAKEEWRTMKEQIDIFLKLINTKKVTRRGIEIYYDPALNKVIKKDLKVFEYPEGTKISKPKPKIDRNIEIINKSKNKNQKIESWTEDEKQVYKYGDEGIETEVFTNEDDLHNSKNNRKNIKTIRHRMNKLIK
jgi:hypothetical protein